jgi:predicted AAA+ superfamily ATPase
MDSEQILSIIGGNIELAKKGKFRKRAVLPKASKLLAVKHILSLVGVRRCGKSTIMKELVRVALKKTSEKNILYLNLENPFFNQYKNDVSNLQRIYELFLAQCDKRKKIYVFFDEIQFFTDWQVFIKYLYEKNEAKIVLTGSNSRLLSSELATLLSGRTIPLHIYPFSIEEAKSSFDNYLVDGGFPEIVLDEGEKKQLVEIYYKNILYQDVIPRFGVQNVLAIENLSYYLLSNFGKEISYNTLKSLSHLDDKTAKQYISYLQDANLLYAIHNYDFSLKKLIGNKKKVYLVDNLFASLGFKNSPDYGQLFENYIFMVLKRLAFDIYFYQNGGECDFLVKEGMKISRCIQVCYELTHGNKDREVKGLISAMKKFKIKEGYIVTKSQRDTFEVDGLSVVVLPEKEFRVKFGMNSE